MPVTAPPAGFEELRDPAHIEKMIRDTGGVPLRIQDVDTWAHEDSAPELAPDVGEMRDRPGGAARRAITFATGVPPDPVKAGNPVTVDGEERTILDHTERRDGLLTSAVVGEWLHAVHVFRPTTSGSAHRGQQKHSFDLMARRVPCEIKAQGGSIRGDDQADRAETDWRILFPPDRGIEVADRLYLVAGAAAAHRFRVLHVGDVTDRWRLPVRATESEEDFPGGEFTNEFTTEFD